MAKGDHLMVSFGIYQHHAIDMGDGRVIQYGSGELPPRNNEVTIESYETLAAKGDIVTLDVAANFSADEVIARATSRIGEKNYSLLGNNCEHFVNWCRTGQADSRQVDRTMQRIASCAAKLSSKSAAKFISHRMASAASKRLPKPSTPLFLLADVAQLGAEIVASNKGANAETAEQVGMATGLGTSVGVGLVTAGPLGAVAGAGLWAFGEIAGRNIVKATQSSDTTHTE